MLPGTKVQSNLERIKSNVEKAYQFSAPNYRRFSAFRQFLYKSTLTDSDLALLTATQKPQVAFNVGEAYISRLRGEFAEQIPDIEVGSDSSSPVSVATIENVEGHMRYIFCDKSLLPNSIYEEQLSGGFSVMKIYTDYEHELTFNQCIKIKKAYDCTLVGFDPMAVEPTKSDGLFCFECFPKTYTEFQKEYPDIDVPEVVNCSANFGAFNWAYRGQNEEILLIVDYYEKKSKRARLLKLSNGKEILESEYKSYMEKWQAAGIIEQPAMIVQERWTMQKTIIRYRLIHDRIIEKVETDFEELPLIYVPGNCQRVKDANSENVEEIARPYLYHAQDAIRMKNYAGQCLVNELENLVQHKFIVQKEAIPDEEDYKSAYTNVQQASTLIYNGFLDDDQQTPLTPPIPVQRPPIPQEIMLAFQSSDQTIQAILGSYNAALGINGNDISGKAIIEGATNSNAAAMPYVMGYLEALEQAGKIIVGLIPKYYKTPRTIPIINDEGKRSFVKINQGQDNMLDYSKNALNVKVRAGANFAVQKHRALEQVLALTKASQEFAAFFNQKGLPVILDNLEIRGVEKLKDLAREWTQEMQQQKAEAAKQPNPEQIKLQLEMGKLQNANAKLAKDLQQLELEKQLRTREFDISENDAQNETMRILLEAEEAKSNHVVQLAKAQTEKEVSQHDMAIKQMSMHHDHAHDKAKLAHELIKHKNNLTSE